MGRRKSNNNWSGPLSKAERKRVKEGFTVFEIMNISDLSSIHAGPLAEFLGKEWRWGNPDKPIPHKAVYYAYRACLGGNHPRHWVPRVH